MIRTIVNQTFYRHLRSLPLRYYLSSCPPDYTLFPIEHYDLGQRLDRYLKATAIGWISAQKYLRNGSIKVIRSDGTTTNKNSHRFQAGDHLILKEGLGLQQLLIGDKNPKHIEMNLQEAKQTLDRMIIFDNENIAIVNKPPGFSVQGGSDISRNLFSLMAARYRKEMVYISHRLDKPTSGIVALPKNIKTAQLLGKAFESRQGIDKYYLAITEGNEIRQKSGSIGCHIEWTNKHRAKISQQIGGNERSQYSETVFLKVKQAQLSDITWRNLLGLKLLTGRKHQIRCHLSEYLVNPIINDSLYRGRADKQVGEAIYLHAFALKLRSKDLIQQVFQVKGNQRSVIASTVQGIVEYKNDELQIKALLPEYWINYHPQISFPDMQSITQLLDNPSKIRSF